MLLNRSPEYWAREATLDDLTREVQSIVSWSERAAAILDSAYVERSLRILGRTQMASRAEALALADHLASVAHDNDQAPLEGMSRPYFARWRLLAELMQRHAMRLELPSGILTRKHVVPILRRIKAAGGKLGQSELTDVIANEGQRSALLKLMEQWDLIERQPGIGGNTRRIEITELGRLAIAEPVEGPAETPASAVPRGCLTMYDAQAAR